MGQYHLTVNLDKKEFLMPHKLGVGLKLREQTGFGNSIPDALFMLACSNGKGGGDFQDNQNNIVGRWAGDRIAIVGDYAESTDLPMMWDAANIYSLCHEYGDQCGGDGCTADTSSHYFDITDMVIPVMMLNDDRLFIDVASDGWRSRKRPDTDAMVSMDDILQGKLTAEEWDTQP